VEPISTAEPAAVDLPLGIQLSQDLF